LEADTSSSKDNDDIIVKMEVVTGTQDWLACTPVDWGKL